MQITVRWVNPNLTTSGTAQDSISSIMIWRNDLLISEIVNNKSAGDTLEFSDTVERPDTYRYQMCVKDSSGTMGRKLYTNENWYGGIISGIVIWDLDKTPISGDAISNALDNLGYDDYVYNTNYSIRYPLESGVDAVFVCLGVYDQNKALSSEEGQKLADYLDGGGRVYMEGGDTWFWDTPTPVHPYFQINGTADGTGDLSQVAGEAGTPYENMNFNYSGENWYIDHIEPTALSQKILYNSDNNDVVAVAFEDTTYRTIGTVFEFGGLVDGTSPSTKSELLNLYLNFFGINNTTGIDPGKNADLVPKKFIVYQNYPNPFNNSTIFKIAIHKKGKLRLQIFDVTGAKVYEQNVGNVTPDVYKINWNGLSNSGSSVASGVYFYRFVFEDTKNVKNIKTEKLAIIK